MQRLLIGALGVGRWMSFLGSMRKVEKAPEPRPTENFSGHGRQKKKHLKASFLAHSP
jgi:hypothetical protein